MFHQILQPVANNLFLSFLVGLIPIAVVLVLLGIVRRPAWQAAGSGLIVGLIIATGVWHMPGNLAVSSTLEGFAFAILPVMWIVWNAMWLYNVTVRSGKFDLFRRWMVHNVPPDRRILMLVIAFSFGALLEGIAGFGTPVAIASALLTTLGFPVVDAIVLTLIFNTSPVAFGALGAPVVTLAGVTKLPAGDLSAMIGRQLPLFALILPFYALIVYTGVKGLRSAWPAALVAGLSFAITQFTVSNFVGPELPDVLAALVSLICLIVFVQFWKPRDMDAYRVSFAGASPAGHDGTATGSGGAIGERDVPTGGGRGATGGKPTLRETIWAWVPWVLISAVVIAWIRLKVPTNIYQKNLSWPGLDKQVFLTLYHKPYAAVYAFQPLGTGTAIFFTVVVLTLILNFSANGFAETWTSFFLAIGDTWRQLRFAILTVVLILGLAYLYNYSGMAYTLGLAVSSVGAIFPFLAVFLGWIACFLSGSDTSSNALFGNLQVVAARQLHLSPTLMAAANSSGAVMSKMISPQNVTTGVSTTSLVGKEGSIIRRTFMHSIILECMLGVLVLIQQYVIPGVIPH